MPLTTVIRASPFLQRFVLEAIGALGEDLIFSTRHPRTVAGSYPRLKKVEFVGYCGVFGEHEIITHLLENAVALEEVIIYPCKPDTFKSVRARARKQLTKSVPSRVNLKIL